MYEELTNLVAEALDFQRSNNNTESREIIQIKRRIEDSCDWIEKNLQGTINYYKGIKDKADKNPSDMNQVEALEQLAKHLQQPLAQFQNFT